MTQFLICHLEFTAVYGLNPDLTDADAVFLIGDLSNDENIESYELVFTSFVYNACDNFHSITGETVTCNSLPPNPTTTNIQAAANSTNVVVNIFLILPLL